MPYTVKQVSALTGIAPDRLRAWERRYGVVTPARTESRYRLYDEHDVERLRMMVRLVDAGAPASLAAQQVREAFPETPDNGGAPGSGPVPTPPDSSAVPARDALVPAALSLERGEVEQVLDRAFAAGSFESVVEHWLLPALGAVGDAWADGRVDVAGEHFVSAAVRSRLGRAFDAAGIALGGPVVLVGLPPGSLHELGSLAFATCLRRLGADVRWLGSDLPADSWAHAADRLRPAAAVLTVPTPADASAADEVTRRLVAASPGLRVFVGGGGAASMGALGADGRDGNPELLPDSVVTAAHEVAAQLRRV